VDDFSGFRRVVRRILERRQDFHLVGEASDGIEAIEKAVELRPDLIVLDIGLPKLNGLEAATRIRSLVPESKILFVSVESSVDLVREALSLGAGGYVLKSEMEKDLLPAVEAIVQNKLFVSSGLIG
jgi:DNA-binding NarL/FixJ family response regulator